MHEYSDKVFDHFQNPRNVGVVEDGNGYGIIGGQGCGDVCEITVRIEKETVEEIKFRVYGCVAAIATASAVTELVKGKKLDDALQVTDDDVVRHLGGLPEGKKHCSLMAVKAFQQAAAHYFANRMMAKEGKMPDEKSRYRQMINESLKELRTKSP